MKYLNDDESSFDESIGSDDVYVPPKNLRTRRNFPGESDSSSDTDDLFEHQDQLPTQEAEEIENAATDQIL